jgi:hypothetical protein
MVTTFQTELAALQAAAGSSIDLAYLQNMILQNVLKKTQSLLYSQKMQMEALMQIL